MSSMNHQDYKDAINTCLFYWYHKRQVLNTGYIDGKHACHQNKTAAKLVMREVRDGLCKKKMLTFMNKVWMLKMLIFMLKMHKKYHKYKMFLMSRIYTMQK